MISEFVRQHKITSLITGVIILALVGYFAYTSITRAGKEPVSVYLVPGDATLTVNGMSIGAGTAYLTPGSYTVKASKDGFEDYSGTITVGKPNTTTIDIALTPASDTAKQWAKDHQNLYLAREARAGQKANQEGEAFSDANPITSQLPYSNFLYTIGYQADTSDPSGNSIIVTIDALQGYRNAAVQKIRDMGYDPTTLNIKFRNYVNPFSHE